MTKKFKRPDGTEEEVTGTAEEIAAYERALRGEVSEGKKPPPVLKGAELDGEPVTDAEVEYIRSFRKMLRDPNTFLVPPQVHPNEPRWPGLGVPGIGDYPGGFTVDRIIVNPQVCPVCGQYGCMQTHITCLQ